MPKKPDHYEYYDKGNVSVRFKYPPNANLQLQTQVGDGAVMLSVDCPEHAGRNKTTISILVRTGTGAFKEPKPGLSPWFDKIRGKLTADIKVAVASFHGLTFTDGTQFVTKVADAFQEILQRYYRSGLN